MTPRSIHGAFYSGRGSSAHPLLSPGRGTTLLGLRKHHAFGAETLVYFQTSHHLNHCGHGQNRRSEVSVFATTQSATQNRETRVLSDTSVVLQRNSVREITGSKRRGGVPASLAPADFKETAEAEAPNLACASTSDTTQSGYGFL